MNRFSEIIESFSPLVQKVLLNPEKKVRLVAANGIIMPQPTPSEFVTALFFLQYDQFDDIKDIAKERFFKIPEATFFEALKTPLHKFILSGIFHAITQQEKQSLSLFKMLINNRNIDFKIFLKKVDRLSLEIRSYLAEALAIITKELDFTAELLQTDISKADKQKIIEFAIRNGINLPIKNFDIMRDKILNSEKTTKNQNKDEKNSFQLKEKNDFSESKIKDEKIVENQNKSSSIMNNEPKAVSTEPKERLSKLTWNSILDIVDPTMEEMLKHPKRLIMAKIKPMKPEEKLSLLYYLTYDPDEEISKEAQKTLYELPENIIDSSILYSALNPNVLDEVLKIFFEKNNLTPQRFEKIVFHKMFQFDILQGKIELLSSDQIELITNNIQGLMQFPSVISEIYLANNTPSSIAQRLLEFCFRHNIVLTEIENFDELKSEFQNEGKKERDKSIEKEIDDVMSRFIDPKFKESKIKTINDSSTNEDLDSSEEEEDVNFKIDLSQFDESSEVIEDEVESTVVEERKSLMRLIGEMNIAEKIKLAMKGNMEARGILIKQSSRLVVEAVIRNPMVTDQEALRWSSDKNTPQEVIRFISNNRKWMRKVAIKMNILKHPKTPLGKAVNLLENIPLPELKSLSRVSGLSGNLKRLIYDAISKIEKRKAANKKK